MFVITTICDSIRVPPSAFAMPTAKAINIELDKKYPNRVIYDTGLCISRWGDPLDIGDGICAPSDGGAHYEVVFRLLVFRPFVDEVCIGKIVHSSEEGIRVSVGFFNNILIPSFWMLRPSHFDHKAKLWVWTPNYEDDGDNDGIDVSTSNTAIKQEEEERGEGRDAETEDTRYEMEIGAKIKFKVKSLNFMKVTKSAKGIQATASTLSHSTNSDNATTARLRSLSITSEGDGTNVQRRRRSSSLDLTDTGGDPPCMEIIGSICEDGLGLTSWWEEEEAEDDDKERDKS